MALSDQSDIQGALTKLFELQHSARELAAEIAAGPSDLVLDVVKRAISLARSRKDEADRVLELESIAQILGQLSGPRAVDSLIDILGSDEPQARHTAGIMLEDMAFERFKEVALGIERALRDLPPDHLALSELPYLLIEIPEPGVPKLIQRFLEHTNEEVVAAAIEAVVEVGDTTSVPKLLRLENDTRVVELDEEDDEDHDHETSVSIGELAKEARLMLQSLPPEDRP